MEQDLIKQLETAREIEFEFCRNNAEYFITHYVKIFDPDKLELVLFNLWSEQRRALESILDNRWNIVLKARQLGLSTLSQAIAVWCSLKAGWTTLAISKTQDDGKEIIRRLVLIYSNIPSLIREDTKENSNWTGVKFKSTATQIDVIFSNGLVSTFKVFAASSDAGRSFTANLIILDEWASQQRAEEIWQAVFPTINRPNADTKLIGLSTIKRGSLFEEIFTNPDNGFNKIFLSWRADPRRDEKWYQETLRTSGRAKTLAEYPDTVEEAFMVVGGAFFGDFSIGKYSKQRIDEEGLYRCRKYVALDYGLDMLSAHWFAVLPNGDVRCYRELDMKDAPISVACEAILEANNGEDIYDYLAPPDLWNRSQESGKSRAEIFRANGIFLTKSSNDFEAGCNAIYELLRIREDGTSILTFDTGCAPNLANSLTVIQRDKTKPNRYETAKHHELTHDVDSLRYFAIYRAKPAHESKREKHYNFKSQKPKDYRSFESSMKRKVI